MLKYQEEMRKDGVLIENRLMNTGRMRQVPSYTSYHLITGVSY